MNTIPTHTNGTNDNPNAMRPPVNTTTNPNPNANTNPNPTTNERTTIMNLDNLPQTSPPVPAPFVSPPPASANIPSPPPGFVPPKHVGGGSSRGKLAELAYLPLALAELKTFADYADTIGKTAPPLGDVVLTFDLAGQWATMRKASDAWDKYAAVQESVTWSGVRSQMASLKPAYDLALKRDPSLATRFPNLTALLGAQSAIAKRSAATHRANVAAKARGEQPLHGAVGKKRRKAAEKAALTSQTSSAPAAEPTAHPPAGQPAGGTPHA